MRKGGQAKAPIALKITKGTYRPDRDGPVADMPAAEPPNLDPPFDLAEIGRSVWAQEAPRLSRLGVLSDTDRRALHTYCRTFDEVARLDRELGEGGEYFTSETGFVGQHPGVNQRFKWLDIRRRYECEFGLTPSSRSAINVKAKPSETASASLGKRTG